MSNTFRITPIRVGTLDIDRSYNTYLRNAGQIITQPLLMYVIEGQGKTVLVDTGSPDPEYCQQYQRPIQRSAEEEPIVALKRAGFEPQQLDLVIVTHLHWDHAGSVQQFSGVRHLVQRSELEYAVAPLPVHVRGYDAPEGRSHHVPFWMGPQYQVIDGDYALMEGISIIHTPGHSPGSQTILVRTIDGTTAITGDTIPLYENWEHMIPNTIHVGLREYYESLRRIRQAANAVLPGHEERVLDRSYY